MGTEARVRGNRFLCFSMLKFLSFSAFYKYQGQSHWKLPLLRLHWNVLSISEKRRTKPLFSQALAQFSEGRTNILMATAVLARGLDIPEVSGNKIFFVLLQKMAHHWFCLFCFDTTICFVLLIGTHLTDTTLPGCQCGELRHALRDRGIRSPDRQDRPGWQRRTGDLWLLIEDWYN